MIEDTLMLMLAEQIKASNVRAKLSRTARSLLHQLRSSAAHVKSTFESIPLSLYGDNLPLELCSSWLFALRGGIDYPAERHPNSIQRMFAFSKPGLFDTWDGGKWITHRLKPGGSGLSIATNIWHRMPITQEQDWVVLSFHTAEANKLIEIVGDPATDAVQKESLYLPT